jgi:hypothetical protein
MEFIKVFIITQVIFLLYQFINPLKLELDFVNKVRE